MPLVSQPFPHWTLSWPAPLLKGNPAKAPHFKTLNICHMALGFVAVFYATCG